MYIEISFTPVTGSVKDILIALLSDSALGFEEDGNCLKAIFQNEQFTESSIILLSKQFGIAWEKNEILSQNWNALWESNFEPVVVDDFVGIRAFFHPPLENVAHEIIITPKMSFGTGHHATTFLMLQQMRHVDFTNKSVFDFGTGTGILAILAKRLGASSILASDIDSLSIDNAKENFDNNNAANIQLLHSGEAETGDQFDIILANINRNVLLKNIPALAKQIHPNGVLILSGILDSDQEIINAKCVDNALRFVQKSAKGSWMCLVFNKL